MAVETMETQESLGRLISCLYRYTHMYLSHELEQHNIGSGQFSFLMALCREDGVHQEDLAQSIKIDKATCTRAVKKLVKEGYITRKRDSEDKRAYRIFLTEKGKKMEPVLKYISETWKAILLTGFTEEEKELTIDFLKRIVQNASSHKRLLHE
jgi:DNA-binding MarR family transcriptional regulator